MHEFHIAKDILSTVLQEAKKNNLSKINVIRVQSGVLNALTEEGLQFSFEHEAKGTIAESAKIELEEVDGNVLKIKDFDAE